MAVKVGESRVKYNTFLRNNVTLARMFHPSKPSTFRILNVLVLQQKSGQIIKPVSSSNFFDKIHKVKGSLGRHAAALYCTTPQ